MTGVLCVGIAALDTVYKVDVMPVRAEKHRAHAVAVVTGGCAANAAVAVARLGGPSWLATRLGEDAAATTITGRLAGDGIDCSLARRFSGFGSPVSAVIVDAAGERLVLSWSDPAMPADPAWLPAELPQSVGAVLGDTRWIEGAMRLFGQARARGLPAILDADRKPATDEIYAVASHIAFSAQALRETAGEDDLARALAGLGRNKPCWLAVTDGPRGVLHWNGREVLHTPAFAVQVVDTLAAGDVWHGAFALALAQGMGEGKAIRFANAAAALKCTRFGGPTGAPGRAEVDAFLEEKT